MVNPGDLALAEAVRRSGTTHVDLLSALSRTFPKIMQLCRGIGLDIGFAIDDWVRDESTEEVRRWLSADVADSFVASAWAVRTAQNDSRSVLAALVREQQLSNRGSGVGAYLKSAGSGLAIAVGRARIDVALALLAHANAVPFHRPITLMRASELAREYLEAGIEADPHVHSSDEWNLRRSLGRLVVLSARFGGQDAGHISRAREHLFHHLSTANDMQAAASYLEACVQLYHLTRDRQHLTDAVKFAQSWDAPSAGWGTWHLNLAEIWLHLAGLAQSASARATFLAKSGAALGKSESHEIEVVFEVRQRLLRALHGFFIENPDRLVNADMAGMELPFGLRSADRSMPAIFYEASRSLIAALAPRASKGQYSYRDFLSEMLSHLARVSMSKADAADLLTEAVRLRDPVPPKEALRGARTATAQGRDLLLLGELRSDGEARLRGIELLSHRALRYPSEPSSSVLVALDLESNGPISSSSPLLNSEMKRALQSGDSDYFFIQAARAAMSSPELHARGLGGRGGVATVDDYSGIAGQTFVFKSMTPEARERDDARGRRLKQLIDEYQLNSKFGVIEHLASEGAGLGVVSVRRYVDGRTLRAALSDGEGNHPALESAVEYLAFIHAQEARGSSSGVRRDVKAKEVGRWLRALFGGQARERFDEWWNDVGELPNVPRRDAHSLNWLVDSSNRILAVDLESQGERPVLYELAQLIEDAPVVDPDDVEVRKRLVRLYTRTLKKYGGPKLQWGIAWRNFALCAAARAVNLLTDPQGNEAYRIHAHKLIRRLCAQDMPDSVRSWSLKVANAWSIKSGLTDPTRYSSITNAERTRISRAMSYHLRHNPAAPTTRGGWIYAADLAALLVASGYDVTAEQLLVVAGALGEPRFELDGDEIRAAYGHSLDHQVQYELAGRAECLYHGAPRGALASIFEARAGLSPMARQMVHMTDELSVAKAAARRRREPVFVLEVDPSKVPGLVNAAASTWLADHVPPEALRILTVHEAMGRGSYSSMTLSD